MGKKNHFIGGVLLVAGTTIGAGMLALPVATAFAGLIPSLCVFGICWAVMLLTAFFFLDVNLSLEGEVNFVTMSERTLGIWGKVLCWICYLLLLYSLTAAYIGGSVPLFQNAARALFGLSLPREAAFFCLPALFGGFVYLGTLGVDVVNRALMLGLIASYALIIGLLPSDVAPHLLTHVDYGPIWLAFLVVITSFGYHIIIPSLTSYMHHDRQVLRRTLVWGSVLPLVVYILWEVLALGVVPLTGPYSFATAWASGDAVTEMIGHHVQSKGLGRIVQFFSFFAIVTSFLGVSLSLSDFLTDGFTIKKTWGGRLLAIALTFIPPLLFLMAHERAFLLALEHAGAFVAVLLIFLPSAMAWTLREHRLYRSLGGRALLLALMGFAVFVVALDIADQFGYFTHTVAPYVQADQ